MANWPANNVTDWNTKMLAYLAIGHETDGTHGTKSGFQDRGDPANNDFDENDLTTDGTWNDLDLSSIVSAGAKVVLLSVQISDDAVSSKLSFRKNGNSNVANISIIRTQVANVVRSTDLVVPCDSNRVIEYNGDNLAFAAILITVKGWWI